MSIVGSVLMSIRQSREVTGWTPPADVARHRPAVVQGKNGPPDNVDCHDRTYLLCLRGPTSEIRNALAAALSSLHVNPPTTQRSAPAYLLQGTISSECLATLGTLATGKHFAS
jgi:hypothetical protein